MTLTVEHLRSAFAFFSRRFGLGGEIDEAAAQAALSLLASLNATDDDAPAAVFYAFSRYPRTFPGAARAFTILLARTTAERSGRTIVAADAELGALVFEVAGGRASYDDVRRWFSSRTPG